MSSLYPSLEGMKIDQMMQVQSQIMASQQAQQVQQPAQPSGSVPSSPSTADGAALPYSVNPDSAPMYPGLGNYMGLELSEDVIRENMPEYLNPGGSGQPHGPSGATRPQGGGGSGGVSGVLAAYSAVAWKKLPREVRESAPVKEAKGYVKKLQVK